MAPKTSGAERARRMMALLPLLKPGAELPLAELAADVGATPAEVAGDVATLSMCGLPPFSPDQLVDAFVDGDVVRVFSAPPALDRPLRLTPAEAAALSAALEACGRGPSDPLRRKLAEAVAPAAADVAATLSAASPDEALARVHAVVAAALAAHETVRLEYFSAGRGERTTREVEPWALGVDRGTWYLSSWCRTAGAERVFRLDRVVSASPGGERFEPPADPRPPVPAFPCTDDLPRAHIRLHSASSDDLSSRQWPGALFLSEAEDDMLVDVPYASPEWLARRVVARLGAAEAVAPQEVRDAIAGLARRMLGALGES